MSEQESVYFVCVVPKAYQLGLSLTLSPYMRSVCAKDKRGESDLYIVWHSCPHIPLHHGCQTPTDRKSALAQHAPAGHINTGRHTPSRTQPQRRTHAMYTKRNWRHTPTLTHLRAKRGERILLWVRETWISWFVSESVWCCYGWHLAVRESVAT